MVVCCSYPCNNTGGCDEETSALVRQIPGAVVVDSVMRATHLVVAGDDVPISERVLTALSAGVLFVVKRDWLVDSAYWGRAINVELSRDSTSAQKYLPKDSRWFSIGGLRLWESLLLPRPNNCLNNYIFLMDPKMTRGSSHILLQVIKNESAICCRLCLVASSV